MKNFNKNDKDELFFGGKLEDYTFENVDGNLRISYQGDLVRRSPKFTSYLHLQVQGLFPDFDIFVLNVNESVAPTES
ncbi:hypothetical protein [Tolypothrix sp. VBCCA 56010]|uniref:hypothetical protein n=1 Tax=Tolypothrix sp. VBCCA 56010 TaxID=3137731 RepID=UPI003D7E599D